MPGKAKISPVEPNCTDCTPLGRHVGQAVARKVDRTALENATPLSKNAYKFCSRNLCGGQFSKPLTGVKLQSAYSGEEVNMLSRREAMRA